MEIAQYTKHIINISYYSKHKTSIKRRGFNLNFNSNINNNTSFNTLKDIKRKKKEKAY